MLSSKQNAQLEDGTSTDVQYIALKNTAEDSRFKLQENCSTDTFDLLLLRSHTLFCWYWFPKKILNSGEIHFQ